MRNDSEPVSKWFGGRHALLLGAALLIVAGAWAFIGLLDSVSERHTEKFDERIIHYAKAHEGPPWVREVGRDLTALGGVAVMSLFTFAIAGFLLISGKHHAMWLLLAAVFGGLVISTAIKGAVARDRPPRDLQNPCAYTYTSSFPSGHSMMSAVTYLTLGAVVAQVTRGRWLKVYVLTVAVLLTGLVGISRVYLRVHWPTDVLAGWTGGLVWSLLCIVVAHQLQRRGAVEKDDK